MKLNSGAGRVLPSWAGWRSWPSSGLVWGPGRGPQGDSIQGAALGRQQRLNPSLNVKQASTAAPRPCWAESVTLVLGQPGPGGLRGRPAPGADCCQGAERHSDTQAGQPYPSPGTPPNWGQGHGQTAGEGGPEEPCPAGATNPNHHLHPASIPAPLRLQFPEVEAGKGHGAPDPSLGGRQRARQRHTKRFLLLRRRSRFSAS